MPRTHELLAFVLQTRPMTPNNFQKIRGYTLPELLIGMALGLFVIAAATAAYGISKQTWGAMAAADAVHANARVALRNIYEQAHMAGAAYLKAYDNGSFTADISPSEQMRQSALQGINGTKYVESLTLGHWQAIDTMDCQGNNSTQATVRNDYKLNSSKELTCKDLSPTNSTYQALAEGVEDFQIRYAEAHPNTHTIQWKTADQVNDMGLVLAIDVCLRVASINTVHNAPANPNFSGCQGEALPTDGRVRRTFKRVMTLRNREDVMP